MSTPEMPALPAASTVLIAAMPADGHLRPLLPIAAELVARGHRVVFCAGSAFADKVRATGAQYAPFVHGNDYRLDGTDDHAQALLEERRAANKPGPKQLAWDMEHFFVGPIPGYLQDLQALADEHRPDVLVGDFGFLAMTVLAELTGLPLVMVGITPLPVASRDTAPFGLGLAPSSSAIGRIRNAVLNRVLVSGILRRPQALFNRTRTDLGLPPVRHGFLDHPVRAADAYLQATVPSFEYPRSDLPRSVKFVGIAALTGVDAWTPPAWWDDLLDARATGRPVVLVTQGTVATDPEQLIRPTVQGLAGRDALVVVAAGADPETAVPAASRPANVRVERFIPFAELLPHVDVVVTNGGYGGVQQALAAGVPLVVAGRSEDKAEVTARVGWSGVGVNLRTDQPTAASVAGAVDTVLTDPAHRQRARALAAEYAALDSLELQVGTITGLAGRRAAVPSRR
jgi:MGT family glycosyltransferase